LIIAVEVEAEKEKIGKEGEQLPRISNFETETTQQPCQSTTSKR
jgi:hypothetical protein